MGKRTDRRKKKMSFLKGKELNEQLNIIPDEEEFFWQYYSVKTFELTEEEKYEIQWTIYLWDVERHIRERGRKNV